jgi:hypothetical protein
MTKKEKNLNKDPKYIGVPNICFSLTDSTDKREKKFIKQRKKRGFDDSETWALDCTMANFILPRLVKYLEVADEVIVIDDKRRKDIHKVIRAMRLVLKEDGGQCWTKKEIKQLRKGLKIFGEIFLTLGW